MSVSTKCTVLYPKDGAANAWHCFLINASRSPRTNYLRHRGSPCAKEREELKAGTSTEFRMEMNNDLGHESSEVLPHGFSSDAQPHQVEHHQDSIDPTFRLSAANDPSPLQHLQQTHHEAPSTAIGHQSPGHQSPDKVKKKGSGQGPRLRKACDACSKRKVKVCSSHRHPAGLLMYMPVVVSSLFSPRSD